MIARPGTRANLKAAHAFAQAARIVDSRRGWSGPVGMHMTAGDPNPEPDPNDDPDDGSLADSEIVKIDGKEWKVGDLKRIAATEKRQGKKAGERAVLEALGVDDVDAAKALVEAAREAARADETEAQRAKREAEEERAAATREKSTAAEERRAAALERALVRRGVSDEDLEDAVTMLGRKLAPDADAEAIAEEADALKDRRPELFGTTEPAAPVRRPSGGLPPGRPAGRPRPQGAVFGAGGLARAERRFGKSSAEK